MPLLLWLLLWSQRYPGIISNAGQKSLLTWQVWPSRVCSCSPSVRMASWATGPLSFDLQTAKGPAGKGQNDLGSSGENNSLFPEFFAYRDLNRQSYSDICSHWSEFNQGSHFQKVESFAIQLSSSRECPQSMKIHVNTTRSNSTHFGINPRITKKKKKS